MAASRPANRLAVVSIILGVVGLLTSVILVGIFFGIAAVVTGFNSRSRALRDESSKPAAAVVGIVIGVIAIIVGLGLVVLLGVLNSDPCWPLKQRSDCP
jgi:hypothetical protein